MTTSDAHPFFSAWWLAIRPRTLSAAVAPVIVGSGIAAGFHSFHIIPALVALFCSLLIQIGANLVNDVADFLKGTDKGQRLGPTRVTQSGLLTPRQVWSGAVLVFLLASLGGVYLAWFGGWQVIAIGIVCIFGAVLYTAGPYSFADHGWGDFFAGVFFGFFGVCGTTFIFIGYTPLCAWIGGLAVAVLTTNILVVNNVRDIETDRKAGRVNIPIRYGRRGGEIEYAIMLGVAYLCPFLLWFTLGWNHWLVLLPLITLPLALRLYSRFRSTPQSPAMNVILALTARQLLLYGLALGIGLALA